MLGCLADSGVNFEYAGTDTLEETEYEVVRATFGEVGISPDDYYMVYLDTDTHRFEPLGRVGRLTYVGVDWAA